MRVLTAVLVLFIVDPFLHLGVNIYFIPLLLLLLLLLHAAAHFLLLFSAWLWRETSAVVKGFLIHRSPQGRPSTFPSYGGSIDS